MKILKRLSVIIVSVFVVYFLISSFIQKSISGNKSVNLFGERYTLYDSQSNNFIPFGDEHCWYESDDDLNTFLGISYYKKDKSKNLIYNIDILDTFVYKKDSYILPKIPELKNIDKLIIVYNSNLISVSNRVEIEKIVNYFSINSFSANNKNPNPIDIYAVSENYGGLFQIIETGTIYVTDNNQIGYGKISKGVLPDDIQDIINKYIKR